MPGKDFRAYVAKLKEDEESKGISIPSNDRYSYYKKALPEKIREIHQSVKKSLKKSKHEDQNLEERREILQLEYEDTQRKIREERATKEILG